MIDHAHCRFFSCHMPKKVVPDGPGRRVPIMGRTTADLRRKLEESAAASGRSLALELENRLEKTFDTDNLITRVYRLGSEEKLTRILLDAIRDTMEDYHDLNDDQRKTLISALLISLGENIADRPAVQVLLSADEAFGKESSWHRNAS